MHEYDGSRSTTHPGLAVFSSADADSARPSHHETAVQQYVLDEATRLGLEAVRDDAGNIRVRKPASAGHEQASLPHPW